MTVRNSSIERYYCEKNEPTSDHDDVKSNQIKSVFGAVHEPLASSMVIHF